MQRNPVLHVMTSGTARNNVRAAVSFRYWHVIASILRGVTKHHSAVEAFRCHVFHLQSAMVQTLAPRRSHRNASCDELVLRTSVP